MTLLNGIKNKIAIFLIMGTTATLIYCKDNSKTEQKESQEDLITREEINDLENERLKDSLRNKNREDGNVLFTKGEYKGMKLFMQHCNKCHPGGEKGQGPALNDKKLPDFLIHFQVRQGLGDMPAFKKDQLSKEDVKNIILFVHVLREIN
ncbi:MAG: hypothetical protein K0S32_335 [Bacteroidetes bacterium]|jgi:hypothetical protein|nr:hypothetical protein [Bacteroidota bacterium]